MSDPAQPTRSQLAQANELTIAAYDRGASDYADRHERIPAAWAERMEQFVALLDENAEAHPLPELGRPGDDISLEDYLQFYPVLDAGCGTGGGARALAAHGLPVLAVDLSQGMLDEAGERTARRLPTGAVRYALMDLRRLELPDALCRGVWSSAALLHLRRHQMPRALGELVRVARTGAPMAIFLKRRMGDVAEEFRPYPTGEAAGMPRYFAYYDEPELRELVTSAGLALVDVQTFDDWRGDGNPPWLSVLARKP